MCEDCIMYKEEIRQLRNQIRAEKTAKELKRKRNKSTCSNCDDKVFCQFAFDPYNIDGDCLASK